MSRSKKVERGLSEEEIEEIREAFDLFDTNHNGMIDAKDLKSAMASLGFDEKIPAIFELVADLDTKENANDGGVSFDMFIEAVSNRLSEKNDEEGIEKIFHLFNGDSKQKTVTLSTMRKICKELGENMSAEEVKGMMERASSNGTELTYEEFYNIMVNKSEI